MIEVKKEGDKTILTLDNGHALALNKIVKDYNLKGEKEALSFILSVIAEAEGQAVNNGKGNYIPSDALKNSPSDASL